MPRILIKDIATAQKKLSKIIHLYEQDKMSSQKFRDLVYGLSAYMNGLYKNTIELRLAELEEAVKRDYDNR